MNVNETLIDALGGLFGGIIHKKQTKTSKELTFEKYANISLSAGQFKEEPIKNEIKESIPYVETNESLKLKSKNKLKNQK